MKCNGCGSNEATRVKIKYTQEGKQKEYCDVCSTEIFYGVPDVYFDKPYVDEHLADSSNPYGYHIHSKRQKLDIMRKLGVREAGDRHHGARRSFEGNNYGMRKTNGR